MRRKGGKVRGRIVGGAGECVGRGRIVRGGRVGRGCVRGGRVRGGCVRRGCARRGGRKIIFVDIF